MVSPDFTRLLATSLYLFAQPSYKYASMKRLSIFTLALLAVVLALAVSSTSAVSNADEVVGLKAIRDAFPSLATGSIWSSYLAWSDANLAASCTNAYNNPTGITCTMVNGTLHPTALSIQYVAQTAAVNETALLGLTNLHTVFYSPTSAGTFQSISPFMVLDLQSFGYSCATLNCPLDARLGDMTNLTTLSLISTYGFSTWPAFEKLTQLQSLYISVSYATYPGYGGSHYNASSFAGITTLTSVIVSSSYYYGFTDVPDFSASKGLVTLKLLGNFSTIPDVFTGYVNLTTLDFSGNPYLTKLPASLSGCAKLNTLSCTGCNLTLDDSFFDMSNTALTTLSLSSNNIKSIPTSLCTLPTGSGIVSQTLILESNPVSSVPACFAQNTKLALIYFYSSNFSSFPTPILGLTGLNRLNMRYNMQAVTGNLDFSLLTKLTVIDFTQFLLNGAFPSSLSKIPTLYQITMPGNKLQGAIPDNFFQNLTALYSIDITGSSVTGPFPSSVNNSKTITYLGCGGNKFTSLPDSIQNNTGLSYVDFSDNLLTTIPADSIWKNLRYLRQLDIGGNTELTGLLPSFWAQGSVFPYIQRVNMSFTNYYGDFPNLNTSTLQYAYVSGAGLNGRIQGFTLASGLRELLLDRNALTGTLPNSIGSATTGATALTRLDLSYNVMSGALPVYFTSLTQLATLALNNNGFSGAVPNVNLLYYLTKLQIQNNQFDLCSANPGISTRLSGNCNATNNAVPNACGCENYYTYCSVNTTCPAPDYVPVSTPYSIPVPVKPPTAAPVVVPVFTPADTATPSQSTFPVPVESTLEPEPTAAASTVALSAALVVCTALAALIM